MTTDLPASETARASRRGPGRAARGVPARVVAESLAVVGVFAAAGGGAGWLWLRLWDPPRGTTQDHTWLYDDFPTIESVFSATGLYVVIGVLAGLLLGVLAAYLCRAPALVTLAAVAVGSVVAAYVTHAVGMQLDAPNPRLLALVVPDGTELPENLQVGGRSPFVAWPVGALIGLATTYFLTGTVSAGLGAARPFDDDPRRSTHPG